MHPLMKELEQVLNDAKSAYHDSTMWGEPVPLWDEPIPGTSPNTYDGDIQRVMRKASNRLEYLEAKEKDEKPFALFGGRCYYGGPGWSAFRGFFKTEAEGIDAGKAWEAIDENTDEDLEAAEWWHLIDVRTGAVVARSDEKPYADRLEDTDFTKVF